MVFSRTHGVFITAVMLFVVVAGGLIGYQELILREGQTTILATRPVDPRDLFRGEYVILRYAIESDEQVLQVADGVSDGGVLFIKLGEDDRGIAAVERVQINRPASLDGLWIKGEVRNGRVRFPSIEQFYVPEGSGTPIERLRSDLHVGVTLHEGEARVTHLLDASLEAINPALYME